MNRQDLLDNIRAIVREELHCIVDEQEQRLDALFNPPKHDGNLDSYNVEDGHAEVYLIKQGIVIHVWGTKRDCYLDAKQARSLGRYLVQEDATLEKLTKEQKG